ncbi:hypothetical protein O3M35_008296 [Rhynocoris fuscipes]|uniref:Uncharacterized protein n=1 Tax=Rhynocoris fuscipes TaxID=488301 RepID=A0AAW1DD91_9HEMI
MSISYKITKEDYDHIPYFNGNPSELAFFCDIVENAYRIVCAETILERDTNHNILFVKVKSKLIGPARNILLSNNIVHLLELIKLLKESFADARSFEILKDEIFQTTIHSRESPIDFVNRIQELRNLVYIRLKLDGLTDDNINQFMSRVDKEIIFHIFKCLPAPLSNHIMIFSPNTLDEIRSIIYNKCSFIISNLNSNHNKKSNNSQNFRKSPPQNHKFNFKPSQNYYSPIPINSYNYSPNHNYIQPMNAPRAIEQKPPISAPSSQQRCVKATTTF